VRGFTEKIPVDDNVAVNPRQAKLAFILELIVTALTLTKAEDQAFAEVHPVIAAWVPKGYTKLAYVGINNQLLLIALVAVIKEFEITTVFPDVVTVKLAGDDISVTLFKVQFATVVVVFTVLYIKPIERRLLTPPPPLGVLQIVS